MLDFLASELEKAESITEALTELKRIVTDGPKTFKDFSTVFTLAVGGSIDAVSPKRRVSPSVMRSMINTAQYCITDDEDFV